MKKNNNLKKLSQSDFENDDYSGKKFESHDLSGLDLRKKTFIGTSFKNSNLSGVKFQGTNLNRAILEGCDLTGICVEKTNFNDAIWGKKIQKIIIDLINASQLKKYYYEKGDFYTSDEFYVKQISEKKKCECKTKGLKYFFKQLGYFIWWITSRYGISLKRWIFFCLFFIIFFGLIYLNYPCMFYKNNSNIFIIRDSKILWVDVFTPFYFSVVTFSTLGFGDIAPINLCGRIIITIEVLFGYIFLGILITIISRIFIRV